MWSMSQLRCTQQCTTLVEVMLSVMVVTPALGFIETLNDLIRALSSPHYNGFNLAKTYRRCNHGEQIYMYNIQVVIVSNIHFMISW